MALKVGVEKKSGRVYGWPGIRANEADIF